MAIGAAREGSGGLVGLRGEAFGGGLWGRWGCGLGGVGGWCPSWETGLGGGRGSPPGYPKVTTGRSGRRILCFLFFCLFSYSLPSPPMSRPGTPGVKTEFPQVPRPGRSTVRGKISLAQLGYPVDRVGQL